MWNEVRSEKGITLLSMALQIIVIGVFLSLALGLYKTYVPYKTSSETSDKLASIQEALEAYYIYNGRYPCPAPLNAGLDSPEFGREASNGLCQSDATPDAGTFRAVGRDGRTVRTGTVPVRTLNLSDKYMYDGYKNRFVYAVTEIYAENDFIPEDDQGAISIQDTAARDATSTPGNVVQMVFSTGGDTNGAYSFQGIQVEACDNTGYSGANCDFDNNATFVNTLQKSHNEASNNYFTHMISYGVTKSLYRCENDASKSPKDTTFLIDTSFSMRGGGLCPPGMARCSRMDVARWAMRRVVPAAVHKAQESKDPGNVMLTGFVVNNSPLAGDQDSVASVDDALNNANTVFYDPENQSDRERSDEDTASQLNNKLLAMCPNMWGTPLGSHVEALADDMGDGESGCNADGECDERKRRVNKITVLSDGMSNRGKDPDDVVEYIRNQYPNVEVDVIDVGGTWTGEPQLRRIATTTGGQYYRADNPDELLDALYHSAGICDPYIPVTPVDEKGCGSIY